MKTLEDERYVVIKAYKCTVSTSCDSQCNKEAHPFLHTAKMVKGMTRELRVVCGVLLYNNVLVFTRL